LWTPGDDNHNHIRIQAQLRISGLFP